MVKIIPKKIGCPSDSLLIKGGGDLLSHERSTIGASELNFSVRKGKRWSLTAITAINDL